jgi:hypothetical protein
LLKSTLHGLHDRQTAGVLLLVREQELQLVCVKRAYSLSRGLQQ